MLVAVGNHFGKFVRLRRAMLGMNRRDLAAKVGVDAKTITNVERRETPEGTDDVALLKLSEVLGLGMRLFTDWEEAVADGPDTVYVPFPRAAHDMLAGIAAARGYTNVAAFIVRALTPTEIFFKGGPDDPGDERLDTSSPPPPTEPAETPAAGTAPPKRERRRAPAP